MGTVPSSDDPICHHPPPQLIEADSILEVDPDATGPLEPDPAESLEVDELDAEEQRQLDLEADAALALSNAREDDGATEMLPAHMLQYRTLFGRTYHAESGTARYWAANDEQQNNSMDIIHHILLLLFDGELCLAPIRDDITHALDVGTGTGIWAMQVDFADTHPGTDVTGTDISPIQPSWVPPNLQFELEDCTMPWTFDEDSMDYVHMRYLYGSISDWYGLFREAYAVCKPGGWLESVEASPRLESDDDSVPEDSAVHQWGSIFIDGADEMGQTFRVVEDNLQVLGMQAAGFEDICITEKKVPIGSWPLDKQLSNIGRYVELALEQDYQGHIQYMTDLLGWSEEQVLVYCARMRAEIRTRRCHAWYKLRVVCGRKPSWGETEGESQEYEDSQESE